jgi:hypothetical protein
MTLQQALNPMGLRFGFGPLFVLGRRSQMGFEPAGETAYAQELAFAQLADQEGLRPTGAVLDQEFNAWLRSPLMSGQGNYASALQELQGGKNGLDTADVREWFQNHRAAEAWRRRFIEPQAHSPLLARSLQQMATRQIDLEQIELNGAALSSRHSATVAADHTRIETAYNRLQDRFTLPAARTVTLYLADAQEIASSASVSMALITQRYQQQPDRWQDPSAPATAPQQRPLAAVASEIRAELEREIGTSIAEALIGSFVERLQSENLASGEAVKAEDVSRIAQQIVVSPTADPRLSKPAAIRIVSGVRVQESKEGNLQLGTWGRVEERSARLFSSERQAGSLINALPLGNNGRQALILVESLETARVRPLDEVREQIIAIESVRAAWGDLLAEAERLRARADAEGGLAALAKSATGAAASPAGELSVDRISMPSLMTLRVPPKAIDGRPDDGLPAVALGRPGQGTVISLSDNFNAEAPRVRLLRWIGTSTNPQNDQPDLPQRVAGALQSEAAQQQQQQLASQFQKRVTGR